MGLKKDLESSLFKSIIESSAEGWIISNKKGDIIYANDKALSLFKYDYNELLNKKIEVLLPMASREQHITLRNEYIQCPKNRPHGLGLDVYGIKKDGSSFPIEISLSFKKWDNQTYVISLISDITKRKKKEQRIQQYLLEQQELKRTLLMSQLNILKNQINPHYLFNCLSVLYPLILTEPLKAQKFTKKITETYGHLLQVTNKKLISLKLEMDFLKNYIYLQKIRFGNTFNFKTSDEVEADSRKILPMSLQCLIENVFKHNRVNKDYKLNITISIIRNGVLVSNNITKKEFNVKSHGIGLDNLNKQYELLSASKKPKYYIENNTFNAWLPLFDT